MDNKKDELNEALGAFISRRKMIQMMGFGAAGAAFIPSLLKNVRAQSPKSVVSPLSNFTAGPPIWSYNLPDSLVFAADPVFYNGTIIICTQNSNNTGSIYSLDTQTREEKWDKRLLFLSSDFGQPIIANGVIYVTNGLGENGQATVLYAINADTGNILWQQNYNGIAPPIYANGNLIFVTRDADGTDGHVIAINSQNPNQILWEKTFISRGGQISSPLIVGNTVLIRFETELPTKKGLENVIFALSLQGEFLWEYQIQNKAGKDTETNFELSSGNGNVYFIHNDGFLHALDIVTGVQKWEYLFNSRNVALSIPVYYSGAVYIGDAEGRIYVVQANTGELVGGNPIVIPEIGNITTNPIFIEDGVAYLTAVITASGKSKFYAVDLTSQGRDIVTYDPSANGFMFGLETGVCYCQVLTNQMIAIDLAGLVHQFFAESELMVEDYETSTGLPSTTSFRTHIQLFDPNKNPRLLKSVKVWASGPVTITSDGKSYDLDTNKTAWLMTDIAGELSIVSTAESFTSPALYLWGNFMELNEAIVIYPDHDTLNTLSKVKSADLSSAKAYDGTSLFPSTVTDALASVINNTMGAPAAALTATRRQFAIPPNGNPRKYPRVRFTQNTYIAYPGSSTNLLYQKVAGSTDRTYVAGNVKQWHATFAVDGSSVTYNTGLPPGYTSLSFESSDPFKDFFDNVVNGVKKVVTVIWDATENALHKFIDDAGHAYEFAIKTVEQAAQVLAGIFKTVIGDFKKAAQWLSYVFDWSSIKADKNLIRDKVLAGFPILKTVVDNLLVNEIKNIDEYFLKIENEVISHFTTIQNTVAKDFTGATTPIGSKPLQSQQNAGNNPQLIYGMHGAKSYTKSRWLISKFKENASQVTFTGLGTSVNNQIMTEFQNFKTVVESIIANSENGVQTISDDLKNFFSELSILIATKTSEFVEKSISDILGVISKIAVRLLKFIHLVAVDLLKAVKAIFDSLMNLVTQTIHIPFISDFYKKISGEDLSVLDFFCLVVAVPSTIIKNAANAPDPNSLYSIAILLTGTIYAVFDGILDVFPEGIPYQVKYAPLSLSIMLQSLTLPDIIDSSTPVKLFYAAQAFPIFVTGVDIVLSGVGAEDAIKDLIPFANSAYGVGMLTTAITLAVDDECGFRGTNYITMTQNIFTFLPYIFKPLALGGDGTPSNIALGVIDILCDETAVGLEFAQIIDPNPSCA